jgi:hypothetical protein
MPLFFLRMEPVHVQFVLAIQGEELLCLASNVDFQSHFPDLEKGEVRVKKKLECK